MVRVGCLRIFPRLGSGGWRRGGLLVFDVSGDRVYAVFLDCERAIGALPFEEGIGGEAVGNQMGCGAFCFAYQGGYREGCGEPHEEVDVVCDATYG